MSCRGLDHPAERGMTFSLFNTSTFRNSILFIDRPRASLCFSSLTRDYYFSYLNTM